MSASAVNEPIWRGPLVPIAFAATAGILLDRFLSLPFLWPVLGAFPAIIGSIIFAVRNRQPHALALLLMAAALLGAAYHHWRRDMFPADDIGQFASQELRPVLLRGFVDTPPLHIKRGGLDELRSFAAKDGGRFVLQVSAIRQARDWQTA